MKDRIEWMTDSDIERIHNASLEILWERGMKVHSLRALDLLADAGAKIQQQTSMVRFPPELVERCIDSLPSEFTLTTRNLDSKFSLGANSGPLVRTGSGARDYIDLQTRELRPGTLDDLKQWVQLVDGLDNIQICGGFFPIDSPSEITDVAAVKTIMENTAKPIFVAPFDKKTFNAIVEMAVTIRGSKKNLIDRPFVTILTSATAPGNIFDFCVDTLLLAGEYGIPVEVNTSPLMGGTCPITVAGCLLQINLEILSLVVISQLANPGAPLIYRALTMAMDMANGEGVIGSMECALAQAAQSQFVRAKYNMPIASCGPITDSVIADGQSQIERTAQTFLSGLTGSQILVAAGAVNTAYTADPVQLTIDDEIIDLLYRVLRGFRIDESTLATELIKSMEPGEGYLQKEHTLHHFREEHIRPKCFNRFAREVWDRNGGKDLNQMAQERAIRILKEYQTTPLNPHVQQELDRIYLSLLKA